MSLFPEIIEDILLRLPVKSLVRFKSASKTLYSLISESRFVNLQAKRASNNPKILLFSVSGTCQSLDYETPFGNTCAFVNLNIPRKVLKQVELGVDVIGSCSGLVCIGSNFDHKLVIWNPCTGTHLVIPYPSDSFTYYSYGFGYDPSSECFKIVLVSLEERTIFQIFSSKSSSWRSLCCPYGSTYILVNYIGDSPAPLLNGALHWLSYSKPQLPSTFLRPYEISSEFIALDLAKEKFQKLPMPQSIPNHRLVLGELGGCLSLLFSPSMDKVEIWAMKEYGVKASWSKLLNVFETEYGSIYDFWPLYLCRSREVVGLQDGMKLKRWNIQDGKLVDTFNICEELCEAFMYRAVVYAENLISPTDFNGELSILFYKHLAMHACNILFS
ncbi:hypothetical protein MANES_07G065200v8 [Manihot esculenta]|uniref:Uncharacterized protein n=1 Tax=Manihot esculenta TaxID=3983 RepID=A0ACB7HEX8_MANES|nr:hypothetical protein MANES_07G065200v8 [Manihot esculenta]